MDKTRQTVQIVLALRYLFTDRVRRSSRTHILSSCGSHNRYQVRYSPLGSRRDVALNRRQLK